MAEAVRTTGPGDDTIPGTGSGGDKAPGARRPDVLVIVLDCVRADLLRAELERPGALPFLRQLRDESLVFPAAVSPGSWTIPSHASLFTGLYPWDHGAHSRSGPLLGPGPETIAECLGRAGYASAFCSGNAYVQESTGLSRGFDEVLWGGAKEFFLRFLALRRASCPDLGKAGPVQLVPSEHEPPSPVRQWAIDTLSRAPAVWDALNRVGGKVLGTYGDTGRSVCPWIEPSIDAWLARQTSEQPVFLFVNLIEAHEPYLADAGFEVSARRWLSYARARQDGVLWVRGSWSPKRSELDSARASYVRSLHTLDRRVGQIVDLFRRHGRWQNTLLVLTSDHGQAFLEQGTLYHRFRVDEPICRIPLWLRAPGGAVRGSRSDRWASLIDVPRTLAAIVGRESFGDPLACSLLEPDGLPANRPVYAMTDGIGAGEIPNARPEWRSFLDRLEVAVYRGPMKVVAREGGAVQAFRVSVPARAERGESLDGAPETADLVELARRAVELAVARIAASPYHGSVERRIAGWGY